MKKENVLKTGGISLILAGIVFIVYVFLSQALLPLNLAKTDFASLVLNKNWLFVSCFVFPGVLLSLFGIIALYSKIMEKSGIIGLIGFILVTLTFVLQISELTWEICLYPVIANYNPALPLFQDQLIIKSPLVVLFLSIFLISASSGNIFFGIGLIKSKTLTIWLGIIMIIGALFYSFGPLLWRPLASAGLLIYSIVFIYLGWLMWKKILL